MDRPPERNVAQNDKNQQANTAPASLTRSISPPAKRRRLSERPEEETVPETPTFPTAPPASVQNVTSSHPPPGNGPQTFKSPFQLTKIRDLPPEFNHDAVTLEDLLGDPLIAECWEFNYLHDIDFLMAAFDADVRHLVKVHVVHGFWKREDGNRLELEAEAARYPNVTLHSAYMPEMFGTHHSKMLVLIRHDQTAQIIIHTANLISRDWTNMTQAVWSSPHLPLLSHPTPPPPPSKNTPPIGSGAKFKIDFLNYLRAYDKHRRICKPLIDQLVRYDFSYIKGTLIASVPGRHNPRDDDAPTKWGWAAMRDALKFVPVRPGPKRPDIVAQVSSIATLGPTENWLKNTFLRALSGGDVGGLAPEPDFKVVFPTADEIRRSLDGYVSGGSIHTKIASAQQKKQLEYLRGMFYHWGNDSADGADLGEAVVKEAGRTRAAPHIKTYIRYANKSEDTIDWALVTSANLSKQAWGDAAAASGTGEMRIASYEIGVLVWPALFAEDAVMTGTFLGDEVSAPVETGKSVVALRMPYNLPLQKYGKGEIPWVAEGEHTVPDRFGRIWRD